MPPRLKLTLALYVAMFAAAWGRCALPGNPNVPEMNSVPPAYSFKVYYGPVANLGTATNVGWITNWVSPVLLKGTNFFCVTMLRARDGEESVCLNGSFVQSTNGVRTLSWNPPSSVAVPFTNTVTLGGVFESSTNLKTWETAFAWTERTITNPGTTLLYYRLKGTVTRP